MDEKRILNILLEMQQEMKSQREELKVQREELKAQRAEMKSFREEVVERLDKVDSKLDDVEERLATLKEDTEITRTAANQLLAWAEDVQTQVGIPLYKKAQ